MNSRRDDRKSTHQCKDKQMDTWDMRNCSVWSDVKICQGSLDIQVKKIDTFEELKLKPTLIQGLREAGIAAPREIQNFAFPVLYEDHYESVLISAPSGTGKTTAAIIRALDIALDTRDSRGQVLLAYTTRDAAVEIHNEMMRLGKCCQRLTYHLAIKDGGSCKLGKDKVMDKIVVGTPEKLKEYVLRGSVDPENVRLVVLDGIDSTPSGNGHRTAVARMYKKILPTTRTILLTSATRDQNMDKFVRSIVDFPIFVDFPPKISHRSFTTVEHHYLEYLTIMEKINAISKIVDLRPNGQCIVVCDSKIGCNEVFKVLTKEKGSGVAAYIHGKIKPEVKEATLKAFKDGNYKVLITTPKYTRVEFHCQKNITMVNYDTQTSSDCLDHTGYKERASILERVPGALSVNMIKDRWNGYATDEYGRKMELCKLEDFEQFLLGFSAAKLSLDDD